MSKWAYAVTTTIERREDLLPKTLASLAKGGFDKPRLFVDNCNDPKLYEHFGLEVTVRFPQIKTFGNWILALWELWIREPNRDRYAIFQDDILVYPNLKQYLDSCEYPTPESYINLYTVPQNQQLAPKHNRPCWFLSNQYGRGAIALVFSLDAVKFLLSQKHMVNKPMGVKGFRNVDGAILTAFKASKWKEYCHNPTLTYHIGDKSSMGNRSHQKPTTWRGEDFNAMKLIEEKQQQQ